MHRHEPDSATETLRVEQDERHVTVHFGGEAIADSCRAIRVTEAGHPPAFYIPPEDVRTELLETTGEQTHCPIKGDAHYYHIVVNGATAEAAAWCYPEPMPGAEAIRAAIAFYPARVDACTVDGRPVAPEENPYYGGWVIQ